MEFSSSVHVEAMPDDGAAEVHASSVQAHHWIAGLTVMEALIMLGCLGALDRVSFLSPRSWRAWQPLALSQTS